LVSSRSLRFYMNEPGNLALFEVVAPDLHLTPIITVGNDPTNPIGSLDCAATRARVVQDERRS